LPSELSKRGYGLHDTGMPGRLLYRHGPASSRAHHLHVVRASTLPTGTQPPLRNYLRRYPDGAARYGALRRRLATLHYSGDNYTRAKTALIHELTDETRAERGLPLAPAWEE